MIELYNKLQDKEWNAINKAFEKSEVAGYLSAAAIGLAEGAVIALTEIAVLKVVSKAILAIKGRR